MDKILVDTDVLIDFAKGKSKFLEALLEDQSKKKVLLYINPVILAEFFTDQNLSKKNNLAKATDFISLFEVIEINKKMGILAGELLRKKKVAFMGDAMIAACCLISDLKLATRNKKHFQGLENLKFI